MPQVVDLDVLRPSRKIFKLNDKQFDMSFIPTGITFDVDEIVQELAKITPDDLKVGGKNSKSAYDLSVKLCVIFCSCHYPEMDSDWFALNTSPEQIEPLASAITDTLVASLEAMEGYQKN